MRGRIANGYFLKGEAICQWLLTSRVTALKVKVKHLGLSLDESRGGAGT